MKKFKNFSKLIFNFWFFGSILVLYTQLYQIKSILLNCWFVGLTALTTIIYVVNHRVIQKNQKQSI